MKMTHIDIPGKFNRNAAEIKQIGAQKTGSSLIKLACDRVGISDLSEKDVLDIGCGVRFTQAIINCNIPIKSYTGIDIDKPLINYLMTNVNDSRFSFYHWDMHNERYNKRGEMLSKKKKLPLPQKKYDLIWLFSVLTHLNPKDAEILFYILRKFIKKSGYLFFSALIDNNIASFEDLVNDQPLLYAYYNEEFLKQILLKTKWQVISVHEKDANNYIQHHFVCSPKVGFLSIF